MNAFLARILKKYASSPRRLGGAAQFDDGIAGLQIVPIFDLMLPEHVSPIWSIVYMPPFTQDPQQFFSENLITSTKTVGRLSIGQGGVGNALFEFDWSAGGVVTVPASTVQLSIVYPLNDGIIFTSDFPPPGLFQAWAVPGCIGNGKPNYLTKFSTVPVFPASLSVMTVPPMARNFSIGGHQLPGAAGVLQIQVSDAVPAPLEFWEWDLTAIGAATSPGLLQQTAIPLFRGAAFMGVGQEGPGAAIQNISVKFELAL